MRKLFLIAAACCVSALPCKADIRNPEALRRACADRRAEVEGYVAGWTDKLLDDQFSSLQVVQQQSDPAGKIPSMEIFFNVSMNVCLPEQFSISDLVDHVCKRISAKHDFRGDRASGFMVYALKEKYPCQ